MNLSKINWDLNTAGNWPSVVKVTILGLIVVTTITIGFFYDTLDELSSLDREKQKEQSFKIEFKNKQKTAINLKENQEQLAGIEASLYEMFLQLPTKEEVASLLTEISQTGLTSGLKFKLFKPDIPIDNDFYSELPISIQVVGRYENLGMFISGLALLRRIITVHNINISLDRKEGDLLMSAVIKIYNESNYFVPTDGTNKKRDTK
ncbi:MAG: pilus assembly protein PilO [Methylococcales bacterium]|nr:MAG: pilus assembly protein PilO [Methylococcales bacterium]